jgi:hypothetical protein
MRSRTRSVSQPQQQPRFFLDRSLGRKAVPEALRADSIANKAAILEAAAQPGAYIDSVGADRISRLYP